MRSLNDDRASLLQWQLAERRLRVRVRLLDGRAGEADEPRIRQGRFKLCEGCEYSRCFPE